MKRYHRFALVSLVALFLSTIATPTLAFIEQDPDPTTTPLETTSKANNLQESDIDRFSTAIAQIKDFYVQPISDKKLLEDAIRGMLSGLDPHSEYLDEDAYKTLLMTTTGEFGGLGIEVSGEYGVLKVISPIDDTPAAHAGIKSGDYIVAIDGKLVNEMSLHEAVDAMRGKQGTMVNLTIIRKDEKKPLSFKLTRAIIHIDSVKSKLLDPDIGYIRLSEFQEPTAKLMISAIEKLKKDAHGNLQGLILDLRNNPGGLLESAAQVVDVFLDSKKLSSYDKLIVYTEGRLPNAQFKARADKTDILNNVPMIVLINSGSASASEIVAGALQDYHRAVVVGTTSFGKGSVQTVLPLDDTHAIKLTTALYHTPSGRVIQNKGITPDITIEDLKLTVDKDTTDSDMIKPIREFDLKNHLPNKTAKASTQPDDNAPDNAELAQTDFQLYEALKIIKTMNIVDEHVVANRQPSSK